MNENEYLRRRKSLEAARDEALEQVRLGYGAQIRALDLVWLASPENPAPVLGPREGRPELPEGGEEPVRALLALAPPPPPAPAPPTAPVKKRWPRGGLLQEIREVLPRLPEEFDRVILTRHLSGEPDRSTLCHLLSQMALARELELVAYGYHHNPTRYRWKGRPAEEHAEAEPGAPGEAEDRPAAAP